MSVDQTLGAMLCDKQLKKNKISEAKNKRTVIRFCNNRRLQNLSGN